SVRRAARPAVGHAPVVPPFARRHLRDLWDARTISPRDADRRVGRARWTRRARGLGARSSGRAGAGRESRSGPDPSHSPRGAGGAGSVGHCGAAWPAANRHAAQRAEGPIGPTRVVPVDTHKVLTGWLRRADATT